MPYTTVQRLHLFLALGLAGENSVKLLQDFAEWVDEEIKTEEADAHPEVP